MASNSPDVLKTDYERLKGIEIEAAYLAHMNPPFMSGEQSFKIHSAWIFVTKDRRVLTFTGLPENELKFPVGVIKMAGANAVLKVASLFDKAKREATYDYGPLRAAIYETPELNGPGPDLDNAKRDQANYTEVKQGDGIKGLKAKSNVHLTKMSIDAQDAQLYFRSAIEINKMLADAPFNYDLWAKKGINSHTVSSLVAEKTGELAGDKNGSRSQRYQEVLGAYAPGSRDSWLSPGPNLVAVEAAAKTNPESSPLRWSKGNKLEIPEPWQVHYAPTP